MTKRTTSDPLADRKAQLYSALCDTVTTVGEREDLLALDALEVVIALAVTWASRLGVPDGVFLHICTCVFRDLAAKAARRD